MPTPFEDLYTAAKAIVDTAVASSQTTLALAPTLYGTDFRIVAGQGLYQIQIQPEKDYPRGNINHPRAIVTALIHHRATNLANEVAFLHGTISDIADAFLVGSVWTAKSGIYDLQPDVDPEMEDGGRVGNVITFNASAVVLMDAV